MNELVFVAVKTTGPFALEDDIIELSWATRDSEPQTVWFGVTDVCEEIDDSIDFTKRGLSGRVSTHFEVMKFLKASYNSTIVASSSSAEEFLRANGLWVFSDEPVYLQSYAMGRLNASSIGTLDGLQEGMSSCVFITKLDGTSRNEVLAMRDMFRYLEKM